MTYDLSPSIPDIVEYQLPAEVRRPENVLFVAFLKHYYTWLTANGQPTDFLQNIAKYTDLDLSSGEFRTHLTKTLFKFVPASAKVDKTLLVKYLNHFLKSKGTYESFQFIMSAIYGEELEMTWNADRILRPSANEYSRTASVAIESTVAWTLVEGSNIIQELPTPATATIESSTSTTVNGKIINWLKLNDKSLIGSFINGSTVKVLKNNINRNWYNEKEYYQPTTFYNNILSFEATEEERRPYENLIIHQLNSTFRGVVDSFIGRLSSSNYSLVTLKLKNVTGSFISNNEIYIIPLSVDGTTIVKTDYDYGIVSPTVGSIEITNSGSLYEPNDRITFLGGSGVNVDAYVSEVTSGGVTAIEIVAKGYGYSKGDKLSVNPLDSGGVGLDVEVSSLDGLGAQLSVVSELNTVLIVDGGSGYKVNDELEILGGNRIVGTPPARFRVSSVNSTWALLDIGIENTGIAYPLYSKIDLINTETTASVSGFAATPQFNAGGGISKITISSFPSLTVNTLKVIVNGYGASAAASISSGAISSLSITNPGVNYIDPVIEIIGDGSGAMILPTMTTGTITGYTIVSGGSGYTSAIVLLKERYGYGFSSTPLIRDQTASSGSITGLNILERGSYSEVPPCHEVGTDIKLGSGRGSILAYDFRALLASVIDGGQYYHATTNTISGKGTGATFRVIQIGGIIIYVGVVSGGKDYYYGTTISIPTGGTPAVLVPVIINGSFASVTITSGGASYTPPEIEPQNIIVNSGTAMTLNNVISGTGKVVNFDIINGGRGFYTQAEITPISITISGGNGASFVPCLDSMGRISKIEVLSGGSGYSISDTITITGGGGALASASPVIFGGTVTDVNITSGGSGYKYGTSALVIGDGTGAIITPVVETGVTSVEIINGGYEYGPNTSINVTDSTGTGAEIRPVIENGTITSLIIEKKGTGYTAPVLSTTDYSAQIILFENFAPIQLEQGGFIINESASNNSVAVLVASATRPISSLTVTNAGTNYTYTDLIIVGDGTEAEITLTVDKLGTIQTSGVNVVGSGYTATPSVTVNDTSGYGAVSGVHTINSGSGFRKLPVLSLADKYDIGNNLIASGTKFVCFGTNIGGVRGVSFKDHGADYFDQPKIIFDSKAILQENANFREGETVKPLSGITRDTLTSTKVLLETGDKILTEENNYLVLDFDSTRYETGITATVKSFDFSKNLIHIGDSREDFIFTTEDDRDIVTENDILIVDQHSGSFEIGDVLVGETSKARATIKQMNRGNGFSTVGGNGWTNFSYRNEVGMLNKAGMVIADNNRYQDRAYVISTGRVLVDYEKTIRDTVHPAGFALFGDVTTHTFLDSGILNEIGYNKLLMIFLIYSYSVNNPETNISTMDDLFGEFTKFRTNMPISMIQNYLPNNTSIYTTATLDEQFNSPPLTDPISSWSATNGANITLNDSMSPYGLATSIKLRDPSSINTAYFQKTFTTIIGDSYTIETYITKQINPLTYPELTIGTSYFRLNTETGEVSSNMLVESGYIDVDLIDIGDYYWVRFGFIATSTSTTATISPAKGFITDLTVSSAAASGSIEVCDVYLRNITGLTPFEEIMRAYNSDYIPLTWDVLPDCDLTYFRELSGNQTNASIGTIVYV